RRPVSTDAAINAEKDADVARAELAGARDIRINQRQVDISGTQQLGINRPDFQATQDFQGEERRLYIEYDHELKSALAHRERILANDPTGIVILKVFQNGSFTIVP